MKQLLKFMVTAAYGACTLAAEEEDSLRFYLPPRQFLTRFTVFVENPNNGRPVTIWSEGCSLGYFCYRFKVCIGAHTFLVSRAATTFDRDFPVPVTVPRREGRLNVFDLLSDEWEWSGRPDKFPSNVKVQAFFRIIASQDTKTYKVWTGKLKSDWIETQLAPGHLILRRDQSIPKVNPKLRQQAERYFDF